MLSKSATQVTIFEPSYEKIFETNSKEGSN